MYRCCRVLKGGGGWEDKSVLQWFSHIERMENDMIVKRIHMGACVGSRLVSQPAEEMVRFSE